MWENINATNKFHHQLSHRDQSKCIHNFQTKPRRTVFSLDPLTSLNIKRVQVLLSTKGSNLGGPCANHGRVPRLVIVTCALPPVIRVPGRSMRVVLGFPKEVVEFLWNQNYIPFWLWCYWKVQVTMWLQMSYGWSQKFSWFGSCLSVYTLYNPSFVHKLSICNFTIKVLASRIVIKHHAHIFTRVTYSKMSKTKKVHFKDTKHKPFKSILRKKNT